VCTPRRKRNSKFILGTDDPQLPDQAWQALQPGLKLPEEVEDRFVYQPLQEETRPGTPSNTTQTSS